MNASARLAVAGDNNPPETAAEAIHQRLAETNVKLLTRRDELLAGAKRAPEVIEDEETAQKMTDFAGQIAAAHKNAEKTRVDEKEPFLSGSRAVDGFFKTITDPLADAKKTIEKRLTAFQLKKAEEERKRRLEDERIAREAAEAAAREAAAKAAAMKSSEDLPDAIAAEEAAEAASAQAEEATAAANAKPAELSRTRGEYGAVSSLRTTWKGEITDRATLDLNALRPYLPAAALETALNGFIKAGGRELAGARIFQHHSTTVR